MLYRCRTDLPKLSDWFTIEADRPEDAANEFFFRHDRDVATVSWREDGGPRIAFARVEVEGHDTWVARVFHHGIFRRGGVRTGPTTLAGLAKALDWSGAPEDLIAPGWDGEETMAEAEARTRSTVTT